MSEKTTMQLGQRSSACVRVCETIPQKPVRGWPSHVLRKNVYSSPFKLISLL